jgi:hypothetical protein
MTLYSPHAVSATVDPTLLHDKSDYSKQRKTGNTDKMRTRIFKEPALAYAIEIEGGRGP